MTEKQKNIVEFLDSNVRYHEKFIKENAQEVVELIEKEQWVPLLDILPNFMESIMTYSAFDGTLGNYLADHVNREGVDD